MTVTPRPAPIIVIKKKGGHGGHHGGAWKVAYADFVTAMMSLFIVLWLMGSSEKVKKAVAGYFNDPRGTANLLGTTMAGNGVAVTLESDERMQMLKKKIEEEIKSKKELEKLSKQIEITITAEGLRIELLEGKDGTFFQSGSARLSESGQSLLSLLAGELKGLPNALLIEGHTDATPYSSDTNYTNWELSADRANSARRLLQQDGVRGNQVSQIRGYADQLLRVKKSPYDPSNRRISLLVKNEASGDPPLALPPGTEGHADTTKGIATAAKPPPSPEAKPAPALPAAELAKPSPSKPAAKTGFFAKVAAAVSKKK